MKLENFTFILKKWTEAAESSSVSGDRALGSNGEKADTPSITFFVLPLSAPSYSSELLLGVFQRSSTRFLKQAAFILFWNFFRASSVIKSESWPAVK